MEKGLNQKLNLGFFGGVGSVTGANFLLENSHTKILVDCGLIQGYFKGTDPNYENFAYNPSEINFLIVTHAHADHIGRIGKLVKDGFAGKIISTPATKDLAELMLEDALNLMFQRKEDKNIEMMYEEKDINWAFNNWETIDYHESRKIGEFEIYLKDAGHILGSAIVEVKDLVSGTKIVFSGDLGNSPTPLLRDTESISDADYLVIESVYGDRVHEEREQRKHKLQEIIKKVVGRGGTLIVPVFSLEKTQVFLKELNDLIEDRKVPSVPVFFDSPLGIRLTEVYGKYTHLFNEKVQAEIKAGDDIFDFPKLKATLRRQESDGIIKTTGAKIIIASSGMSEGGRITAHEKRYLPDPKNAILFIGYQVAGSLGRRIQEGIKSLTIEQTDIRVRADVLTVSGYSSHKDSNGLLDFVEGSRDTLKKVFVVMGETKSSLYLTQKIRDFADVKAEVPDLNEIVDLK
ncbi:MAG: MBL fold metallo-hydrolase [Candidatus Paceibacterota bacterium]